jgi:CBS domain containing-hemolysin-like protein
MTIIHETSHTRYPLCETGLDSVVGMIHIKDLFHRANSLQSSEDLRLLQHEMQFVPETQAIDVLQRNFQRRRAHMALVVDEYGVPTGLVTLEDVLEELVGEIQDEFDADEEAKILHTDDGILIDGMLLVEDLCRELDIEDTGGDSDTVGGYVTDQLGRIARAGDVFEIGDYHGRVSEMQGRRIARVLLAPAAGQEPAGGENPAAEDSPASDDPT